MFVKEIRRSTIITLANARKTHNTTCQTCFNASVSFDSSHLANMMVIHEYNNIGIANTTTILNINCATLEVIGHCNHQFHDSHQTTSMLFLHKISSHSSWEAYSRSWASWNACFNKSSAKESDGRILHINIIEHKPLRNSFIQTNK